MSLLKRKVAYFEMEEGSNSERGRGFEGGREEKMADDNGPQYATCWLMETENEPEEKRRRTMVPASMVDYWKCGGSKLSARVHVTFSKQKRWKPHTKVKYQPPMLLHGIKLTDPIGYIKAAVYAATGIWPTDCYLWGRARAKGEDMEEKNFSSMAQDKVGDGTSLRKWLGDDGDYEILLFGCTELKCEGLRWIWAEAIYLEKNKWQELGWTRGLGGRLVVRRWDYRRMLWEGYLTYRDLKKKIKEREKEWKLFRRTYFDPFKDRLGTEETIAALSYDKFDMADEIGWCPMPNDEELYKRFWWLHAKYGQTGRY